MSILSRVVCKELECFEHHRGVAWVGKFYVGSELAFTASNAGVGGESKIEWNNKFIKIRILDDLKRLKGNIEFDLPSVADLTDKGESLENGAQRLTQAVI
jgi:hypothetical protein